VVLACVLYGWIAWGMITRPSDTKSYVDLSEQWAQAGQIPKSHFLFPTSIIAVYRSGLVPSYAAAGLAVLLAFYSLTVLLLYGIFYRAADGHPALGRPAVIAGLAVATLLAQPAQFSTSYEIGYFWPTQHDNATSALAKPFSIITFLCAAWCLSRRKRPADAVCVLAALATVAGALSKPSFLICLLPAAVLVALVRLLGGKDLTIAGLIACLLLPAALVLVWQYAQTYAERASAVNHDRIIWAPLEVMSHYSSSLVSRCLLSVAFPLAVTMLFWNRARRDVALLLAWGSFLIGASYAYLLAEEIRKLDGNFLWSPYAGAFILLMASTLFWMQQLAVEGFRTSRRHWCCAALFFLQAAAGLVVIRRYWATFSI
jgi:hypothetical protein